AGGWGLEAGVLAALSRRPAGEAYCQSELCDRYDHKHRELSPGDPARGLHAMALDILTTLLRALKAAGVRVDGAAADRILAAADRGFAAAVRDSRADALLNGLAFDGEAEALAVRTFT